MLNRILRTGAAAAAILSALATPVTAAESEREISQRGAHQSFALRNRLAPNRG